MKQKSSLVSTGIVSIFLIFSVLCLVILSLLTLGTSRSDLAMSRQTMKQTGSYYDACNHATEFCADLENFLWNSYMESTDSTEYFARLQDFSHETWAYQKKDRQISLEIPFSDTQALLICLDVLYPEMDENTVLRIHTWKTIVTGTWNPDTKQHIFQGD